VSIRTRGRRRACGASTDRIGKSTMTDDITLVEQLLDTPPDVIVTVPGTRRTIAADIDGDPAGTTVLLVHGTPDSRLARHPDPTIAAGLGVRLIAVDRPGFGHSTADPAATPLGFAADLAALLDHFGVAEAPLLAWSAGTIWALGAAAAAPARVQSVTAVGGLVPFEAFADREVRQAAGDTRMGMVETTEELGAELAAEMIAPLLVPDPATPAAALEHRSEAGDTALSAVPGADVHMAAAVCDAVRSGPAGLIRDVGVQLGPSGVDLGTIEVPARFVTGSDDAVCPPAFAHWYAAQLPCAEAEIVPGAGHGLLLTHWRDLLAGATTPTRNL
jgi:pimeloyl-ACP methyl ester carboxylesterase